MHTTTRWLIAAGALTAGCTGNIAGTDGAPAGGLGAGSSPAGQGAGTSRKGGGDRTDPTQCIPGVPPTSQLPRLTRAQYDNTVRDLIGLEGQPSAMLAPDSSGSVDRRAWDGYQAAAQSLASKLMADPEARTAVIPCTPAGDGSECARQLVQAFGQRAFRRPLTGEEVVRFEALYTSRAQITATGSFDEAAELIIRAFLLSPSFLTRAEIAEQHEGDRLALSGFEAAARLSYMLWDSMPDEALFSAAAADALNTPEQLRAQAERMLGEPKARSKVGAFHQRYAQMGAGTRWVDISRDAAAYPGFSAALVPLLTQETERFFDHVVFDLGGTFRDLLSSPIGFVNANLAPLYGLDPAQYGAELVPTNLDPTTRAGAFTRLGFLTAYSLYNRSSPILRGAFIQKEVLCREIGAPPPGAETTALPSEGLTSNRERVDAQTASAECAACHHTLINPTGFALETYDALGTYRQEEAGVPINTSASVAIGEATVNVTGPVELFRAIADSPEASLCYARKWVQTAYERPLGNEDSCVADELAGKLNAGGYSVLNLIADLTQSDAFRYRAVATEVAP